MVFPRVVQSFVNPWVKTPIIIWSTQAQTCSVHFFIFCFFVTLYISCALCWQCTFLSSTLLLLPLCWQVHFNTPVTFVDKCTLLSSTLQLPLLTSVLCYVINTPVTFVDKCTLLCHQHSSYLCWQVYFAVSWTLLLPLLTGILCYVINTPVTFVDKCALLCHQHSCYLWLVYFATSSTLQLPLLTSAHWYVINTSVTFVDKCTLLYHQHSSYLCCTGRKTPTYFLTYLCWQVHIAMSSTLLLPLLTGVLCYVINTPVTFVDRCTLLCHQHSSYLCWQVHFAVFSAEEWDLPNPADRYNKIPEIFKGKNVADFVDPDIDKVDWCCEHLPRKYWHSAWKFLQGWLIFGVYGSGLRLWYSFCFLASFGGFW